MKQQIPLIIAFSLTRPGLEHTIYHTRGEQTNHYNTDFKIASSNSVRFCEHRNPVRLALSPFLINKPFKGTCSKSTIQVTLAHYIFNTNFQNKKNKKFNHFWSTTFTVICHLKNVKQEKNSFTCKIYVFQLFFLYSE